MSKFWSARHPRQVAHSLPEVCAPQLLSQQNIPLNSFSQYFSWQDFTSTSVSITYLSVSNPHGVFHLIFHFFWFFKNLLTSFIYKSHLRTSFLCISHRHIRIGFCLHRLQHHFSHHHAFPVSLYYEGPEKELMFSPLLNLLIAFAFIASLCPTVLSSVCLLASWC